MQTYVSLFVILCVALRSIDAGIDRDQAMQVLTDCKEKTNAQEDIADIIENHNFPTSPEGKCMLHCVLETKGFMKDHMVDTKAFSDYFEKAFEDEPVKLEEVAKTLGVCSAKLTKLAHTDKCEIAYEIFKCGHENHIRVG